MSEPYGPLPDAEAARALRGTKPYESDDVMWQASPGVSAPFPGPPNESLLHATHWAVWKRGISIRWYRFRYRVVERIADLLHVDFYR